MCSLALALTGITTGLSAYGQYQQGKAQAAAYEAQAEAAYQNAKIQNKQTEIIADQYQQKQKELDDRRRLIVGQQKATAGALGISGNVGSPLDTYISSMEAAEQDTINLLTNQRYDTWGSGVKEKNFINQGNAAMANAKAAKQAGTLGAVGTVIGGIANMYAMGAGGGGGQKTLAGEASSTPGLSNIATAPSISDISQQTMLNNMNNTGMFALPNTAIKTWGRTIKAQPTAGWGTGRMSKSYYGI